VVVRSGLDATIWFMVRTGVVLDEKDDVTRPTSSLPQSRAVTTIATVEALIPDHHIDEGTVQLRIG